jgi:glycosyltransferase involved in cell wall biosynthesis
MKIAFDIRGLDGTHGGKGVWTANVLKSMLNQDREDEFFLYTHSDSKNEHGFLPNAHVVQIPGGGLPWQWRFHKALLHDRIDVLVATESYIAPFLHSPKKLKVALVVHDLVAFKSPAKHQRLATWVERTTLARAAQKSRWIFTVSEYTKQDLVQQFPKLRLSHKTTVVHAGVRDVFTRKMDANRIVEVQRRYNLDPDYLLMAGTLEPRKNITGALEAYHLLSPKNQQRYHLVVVGKKGWFYERIFQRVAKLGLESRVQFLEHIPDEDLAALMKGAKLFLFPSFYEGFGLPVLEALQCGIPVLTSRVSSIPEVGGDAVAYADPFSPVDMAEKITRLLEDEDLRMSLREKGIEQAKKFSWGKTASLILDSIKQDSELSSQESAVRSQQSGVS